MGRRPSLAEVHQNTKFDIDSPAIGSESRPKKNDKDVFAGKMVTIPVSEIDVDQNIRDSYIDDSLEALGDSILKNGQLQPIIVSKKGDRYVVKVGHRRFRACCLRDIPSIKCIVENDFKSERERIIIQAIENEQRLNLSSREREAYISRLSELGMTQTEIASALNKTKGWVSEAITSYNFVNENKELFDELSEEPSTRDTWKASTLSNEQLKEAITAAKKQGGSKEAFKKNVDKYYEKNKNEKKTNKTFQKLVVSTTLNINWDDKIVVVGNGRCYDDSLATIIANDVKKYYQKKGFTVEGA